MTQLKTKSVINVKDKLPDLDINKLTEDFDNTLNNNEDQFAYYNIPDNNPGPVYSYDNIIENIQNKMLKINKKFDPEHVEETEEVETLNEEVIEEPVKRKESIVINVKAVPKINESKKPRNKLDKWKELRERKKQRTPRKKHLTESKKPSKTTSSIGNVLESISHNDRKNQKELIEYIGGKMDNISDILKNRPDSYKFDIKRDNHGYIDTVLVKPENKQY